ncbi:aquaporin [Endozoicomonas sp. SM1973]|uniref:Aquaporin n=1 Tax=Spartinivicinus marinus TaxID=2994442 RepID=A0A853HTU0_9GAMM|nr:aquaporin [Spartinivicinus marinus]MCX4030062.1 aquaporin [Spartinivicinus marinus]NYZ64693.1 aquaporin [Spartinivicinus marinus]
MIYASWRLWLAELLGSFMLVFAGTGAIIINDVSQGTITHVGIAATFGLIVCTVIYTYGDVSGAHINPAVTFAFWLAKRFPTQQLLPYIISQLLGACLASFVLLTFFPQHPTLGATLPANSTLVAFILEIILSWWLMTVIFGVSEGAKEKGLVAGIVVGGVVALEAMFAGPISGASMNPARSFGPALMSGNLASLWPYIAGPLIGTSIAVFSCRWVQGDKCCQSDPLPSSPLDPPQ